MNFSSAMAVNEAILKIIDTVGKHETVLEMDENSFLFSLYNTDPIDDEKKEQIIEILSKMMAKEPLTIRNVIIKETIVIVSMEVLEIGR